MLAAIDLGILSIFGGEERSLSRFKALFEKAGLKFVRAVEITDFIFAMECCKA